MTNRAGSSDNSGGYDLAERTAQFGERCVKFARGIHLDDISGPLLRQFVRSSTSIGANYCEADEAGSKKEFRYRISVSKREARETGFWLRMLVAARPEIREGAGELWKESRELVLIFAAIYRNGV